MNKIIKFDNPNYTIGAYGHHVLLRNNHPGKTVTLTVNETLRLIAELEATLNELAGVKANG